MAYSDRERIKVFSTSIALDKGEVREARVGREDLERKRKFENGGWLYSSGGLPLPPSSLLKTHPYDLAPENLGKSGKDRPKIDPRDVSIEEKLSFLKELEKNLSIDPKISLSISYRDSCVNLNLESDNFDLSQEIVRSGISVVAVAKSGEKIARGIESDGARAGYEFIKSFSAEEAPKRALRVLSAKKIKGGRHTVILDPLMVGTLIHEALGHMVEGDTVAAGASALAKSIGKQVASPLINVVDDGSSGYGSFFFDRDGSAPNRTEIVRDGKLVSFLNSRDSGGQLNLLSTGNCRGMFNSVRMTNTSILPGSSNLEEMLDIKEGVYLIGTTGGSTSPSSKTFNFSADEGYRIENGELKENVGEVTLSGDLFQILGDVDLVGKTFVMNGGICGKSGETASIGAGGVPLRTKAMIGGGE